MRARAAAVLLACAVALLGAYLLASAYRAALPERRPGVALHYLPSWARKG